MASTHHSLHYHLVFSTKDRIDMIVPAWRDRLHAFLGGVVKQLDGIPEAIGGVADHVHLLIGLGAMHRLSDVMREIKSVSSRWVHDEIGVKLFSWQEGYGGFTANASADPRPSGTRRLVPRLNRRGTKERRHGVVLGREGSLYPVA